MNEQVAYVQNGRDVTWDQVTTEDLRATLQNYPQGRHAALAQQEWVRRMGKPYIRF